MNEEFYTYLILTENNTLYCGYTNDIEKRYIAHCSGKGAKYTRFNKPLKIAYLEIFDDKSDAMKRESQIKKLSRQEKLKLVETFEKAKDNPYYKAEKINKSVCAKEN